MPLVMTGLISQLQLERSPYEGRMSSQDEACLCLSAWAHVPFFLFR